MKQINCKECGKIVQAQRASKKFCSDNCRTTYHQRKRRQYRKSWKYTFTRLWRESPTRLYAFFWLIVLLFGVGMVWLNQQQHKEIQRLKSEYKKFHNATYKTVGKKKYNKIRKVSDTLTVKE